MPHYMIWSDEAADGEAYWILASSPAEARQLIALSVEEARGAADIARFQCFRNDQKQPPPGLIYRRNDRPVTVKG